MKELLKQHVANNAYLAKKSTRLLDQYKFLNSRLGRAQFYDRADVRLFRGAIAKLPCYANKMRKTIILTIRNLFILAFSVSVVAGTTNRAPAFQCGGQQRICDI